MKTAVISDIHSNLEALVSTLRVIDRMGVDQIFCLGDIVGYGPYPNECIALVQSRCAAAVLGNHDSGTIGATPLSQFTRYGQSALRWTQMNIHKKNLEYLSQLPFLRVMDGITIVHGSPNHPEAWPYVFSWHDAERCFPQFDTRYCFIGHTHIPSILSEDGLINAFHPEKRSLINVGSVGQPRDGNPKASFGVLDTEAGTMEMVRLSYDVEKTAKAILRARLPDYLAQRLFLGI